MSTDLVSKTLAFRTIDDKGSVIVVVGPVAPADGDWNQLVEAHKKERYRRTLVVTAGGGPTPTQRKAILDVSGGKGLPAAILTDSVMVRGIVTALSWFVSDVRAYPPHDLHGALAHLRMTTPPAVVQRVVDELKRELEQARTQARSA